MKTPESARKKVELRERLLNYAREHAENDRIPTVAELREALGVTNYLLLNCMNELIREGLLYRKSRKEGTFLAWHQKKYVIGLFEDCGGSGFVDIPAWMSGFYRAFTRTDDFLLRIVQCPTAEKLPAAIRQYGLDSAVWFATTEKNQPGIVESLPETTRAKIICALVTMKADPVALPRFNSIRIDHDYWAREYVRAAVRHGCRNFLLVAPPDRVSEIMRQEIKKAGLVWHPECLISDPEDLREKLPGLVRKYKIDAVRCAGGMQHSFALAVKNMCGFHPFMPVFGSENMYRLMKQDYPWLNTAFIFEHLDDFYERLGFQTGQAAIELAKSGKPFVSRSMRMNYSNEYKTEIKKQGKDGSDNDE